MQIIVAWIVGGFLTAVASFVGRLLVSLAIGYVTYQGISFLLDQIESLIFQSFAGLSAQVIAILGLLQIGSAISVTLSAVAARLVINGLVNGAMTKAVIK